MTLFRTTALIALFAGAALPAAAQSALPTGSPDSLAVPRKYVAWFWEGRADSLWSHLAPGLRRRIGSPDAIVAQFLEVTGRFGAESAVLEERLERGDSTTVYRRTMKLELSSEPLVFTWVLAPDGSIADVGMRPRS
ncbi:MAG TPA: hypothetical protein VNK43_07140 [Gemmatimonadales bacterium]|nr:hypothetical protein [Gemmatimonadales bacterium]